MKIRSLLMILVAALAIPLVLSQSDHIAEDYRDEVAQTEKMLSAQSDVMATNIGAKLRNARHQLEYLAALPPHTLLDPQHCEPSLGPLLALHPEYANIVTDDMQGQPQCSAVPMQQGQVLGIGNTPWFQRLLKERRFTVGEPFFGPIAKKQVMVLSQPIWEGNRPGGTMLGAVNIVIALTAFDPQLPTAHLPRDIRYGIFDERGVLFWRNDGGGEDIARRVESEASRRIIESRDEEFFTAVSSNGREHYYAVKPLPEFGLVAFVALPVESVQAEPRQRAINKIVGSTCVILLLVALAAGITRRIVRPVIALGGVARAMREGDTTARASVAGPQEIADLAQEFNALNDKRLSIEVELRRQAEELHVAQIAMGERVKEQQCLYAVFRASEDLSKPLPDMLREVAELLPPGWFYPEVAAARIELDGEVYATADVAAAKAQQSANIEIGDVARGSVTVAYLAEKPLRDEGPFLVQERALIDTVAQRLASILDRRAKEDLLQDSEERFRHLFEDTRQAITLVENGRFVATNRASLAMFRMEHADQLIGASPADISPEYQPDGKRSADKVAEVVGVAFATGTNEFDWEHIRADGEHFIARVLLTAIRQGDKDLLHVVWTDISDQKRAERELRKLSLVVEQSPNTVVITDLDCRIEYVNDAFCRNTGYSRAEALGQTPRILASGKTPKATYQSMWETLLSGVIWHGEFINKTRAGVEQIELATIVPLRDSNDKVSHYVAVKEDITDKKRMNNELAEYREHLEQLVEQRTAELSLANEEQQAIFDTASSGIALITERVLARCNRRMHEMFGWPQGEMVGKPTAIWYADDAANDAGGGEVYEQIWRGEVHCRDQQLMRRDGSLFWARLMGTAVDVADRSKGTVWVIDDITAERAAISQMREAKALAEEAAQTKANFLANMSHEIRTPMNAVMGMTHLALKTDLNPRQREYLTKIQGASQHLLGIINDILDISKIEAGKMTVEHVDFELQKVLDNVAGLMIERTAAKGLEFIVDVHPDVPEHLVGDPLRVGQILINYANNAIKFTDKGQIDINVSIAEQNGDDLLVLFSVHDTGIGIAEDQRDRLFQSFQQADTSTTRQFGGTGLGLAISKRLAEMMDGSVGLDSNPGVGSTFWFTARLRKGQARTRNLMPEPDLRGRRVLVVDDNDYARDVVSEMLRSMTFITDAASSGAAAITEIKRAATAGEPYEIIFLDWQMPGMDGIATAQGIKTLGLMPPPHLIMITAYGREELIKPAEEAGIEDILIKPVSPSLLFDTVMQALGATRSDRLRYADVQTVSASASHTNFRGLRVLLVEDNDLNQEVANEMLRYLGLEVDIAADGAIALDKVSSGSYDLVLMDMQMPVMDGLTATREIRKKPEFSKLPILAMTANAMESDRERCLAAGMNDHIAKPIDPNDLTTKLLRWLGPQQNNEPVASVQTGDVTPVAIQGIAGLDPEQGMRQALGREQLYLTLLRKFVAGQHDFGARLDAAIRSTDWSNAKRIAHTLKGVSAQIGAYKLRAMAEKLEHTIDQQHLSEALATLRADVCLNLDSLIQAIQAQLPSEQSAAAPVVVDVGVLREVCTNLSQHLANDDFGSTRLLEDNEALLRSALGENYARIAAAISDFDFAEANNLLKSSAAGHGISL